MKYHRISALLGAAVALGCASSVGAAGPAAAATTTLTAQSTYLCDAYSPGQGSNTYKVTLRMRLNAPTSVAPGQTLNLAGQVTLQFDERLYASAKSYGIQSISGYSDTLSATSLVSGAKTVVKASRFQTSPQPIGDPIVVTGPISLQPFTVPASARGGVTIGLPQNNTTPNPASSSPPSVAFTVYASASASVATFNVIFGCYMSSGSPGTLGTIPVVAHAAPAASVGSASGGGQNQGAVGGHAAAASTAAAASNAASAAPTTATASGSPASPGATSGSGSSQAVTTPFTPASQETGAGVYVPTGLLLFGGTLICVLALGYAAVTNARLRMIKRAMDG